MSVSELSPKISTVQRERILRGVFEAYYSDAFSEKRVVFDTNRRWCGLVHLIAQLFPTAYLVCCVRNPAWILDSVERKIQEHPLLVSGMFRPEQNRNLMNRVEAMVSKGGVFEVAINGFRQAWFGEHADRLIVIPYERLAADPSGVVGKLYEALEEPSFPHDFSNVHYADDEYDEALGMPGMHTVRKRVEFIERRTILPPDIFAFYDRCFWDMPEQNSRGVMVL
jgi:sulfotransferase